MAAHMLLHQEKKDVSRCYCQWRPFSSLPVNHTHVCHLQKRDWDNISRLGRTKQKIWSITADFQRIRLSSISFSPTQNIKFLGVEVGSSYIGEGCVLEVCLWTGCFASCWDAHQQGLGIASALFWIPNASWGWSTNDQGGWLDAHCHRAVKSPSLQLQMNDKQVWLSSRRVQSQLCDVHVQLKRFSPLLS